jgi:NitT/TauT family transport system ATP-binding protein
LASPLPRPARIGFVFQDPNLLPWRDVRQNIALPLELQHVARGELDQRVAVAYRLVGLRTEDLKKLPKMLSGGMRMRVSFARAIVTQPDIMLMDEPFAALDDLSRQQLNEELLRVWMDQGWTSLFVTHNVAEAVFLSQRVLVMATRPGRLAAELEVPFPYPRDAGLRATPEFAALTGQISRSLREVAS